MTYLKRLPASLCLIALLVACFWLASHSQAVSPAPDGGYTGANTAEGNNALFSRTTGMFNTAIGFNALNSDTSGGRNTGIGVSALRSNMTGVSNTAVGNNALLHNTADENTAVGDSALFSNTTGFVNTGVGFQALRNNTTGGENTAVGEAALSHNTTAGHNTAIGAQALLNNAADNNTAVGAQALGSNTTGTNDTAVGNAALFLNTTGIANTATGDFALVANTEGNGNTADGNQALQSNTFGNFNTATGNGALLGNVFGTGNTADGYEALFSNTGVFNTATGKAALRGNTTGFGNTAVGYSAGMNLTTGNNNIDIGYNVFGATSESNTVRIGNSDIAATYIAGIVGTTIVNNPTPVYINLGGQLGTIQSSARFKRDIHSMDTASEAILALNPVTFHYKNDTNDTLQFGLVAEEVEKVNPDLVLRDNQGKPYSVRYDAVNAMLLNEFLKDHKKVQEQRSKIEKQETTIVELKSAAAQQQKAFESKLADQQKQIEALTSGLEELSTELDADKRQTRSVAKY